MSFAVTCSTCGKTGTVPDAAGGHYGRCAACGNVMSIPTPAPASVALIADSATDNLEDDETIPVANGVEDSPDPQDQVVEFGEPQSQCNECGGNLPPDAAFCSRCGKKASGSSLDELIETDVLVSLLREYGELNAALTKWPTLYAKIDESKRQAERDQDFTKIVASQATREDAQSKEGETRRNGEELAGKLRNVDRSKVLAICNVIMAHEAVPNETKEGLRLDYSRVFSTEDKPTTGTALQELAGAVSAGTASPKPTTKPPSKAMVIYRVLWGMLMLAGAAFVLYLATQEGQTDTGKKLLVGLVVGSGGIFLILAGMSAILNACPRCACWAAAELVDAELMDRQLRAESVQMEDRHYDNNYRYLGSTKRQGQQLVTVDTHLKTYRCKYCHHYWQKLDQTRQQ